MRCPICKQRVANKESLQDHYLEDCSAIGDARSNTNEDTRDLVEVDFKWVNTKGTDEGAISLISSLADQILLERAEDGDLYQSAKILVPCGIHCCQLAIGGDCHPVIDIEIDTLQESLYVILQSDLDDNFGSDDGVGQSQLDTETEKDEASEYFGRKERGYGYEAEKSASKKRTEERSRTHQIWPREDYQLDSDTNSRASLGSRRERTATEHEQVEERASRIRGTEYEQSIRRSTRTRDQDYGAASSRDAWSQEQEAVDRRSTCSQEHEAADRRSTRPQDLEHHEQSERGSVRARATENKELESRVARARESDYDELEERISRTRATEHLQEKRAAQTKDVEDEKVRRGRSRSKDSSEYQGSLSDASSRSINPLSKIAANGVHEALVHTDRNTHRGLFEGRRGSEEHEMLEEHSISDVVDQGNRMGALPHGSREKSREASYGLDSTRISDGALSNQISWGDHMAPVRANALRSCDEEETRLSDASHLGDIRLEQNVSGSPKYKASKSEPYGVELNNERMLELQAKCASYETELARLRKENEDLLKQLLSMEESNAREERINAESFSKRLDSVMRENKKLREENESLKTAHDLQMNDMEKANKDLIDKVNELSADIERLKYGTRSFEKEDSRKILKLEAELANNRVENEELKLKLDRIRREFIASQTDLSESNNNLSRSLEKNRNYSNLSTDNSSRYVSENSLYSDTTREISPSRELGYARRSPQIYDDLHHTAPHEPIIKSSTKTYNGGLTTNRKSVFDDDYDSKYTQRQTRLDNKLDNDFSYLPNHDLTTRRYHSYATSTPTTAKSPRVNHSESSEPRSNPRYPKEHMDAREHVDFDSILAENPSTSSVVRREKKSRRERPHSFHGGASRTSYYDSPSSSLASSPGRRDSYSSGLDKLGTTSPPDSLDGKCFYPSSPEEISIGMRALVTRTSGRLGKGLVKWKGKLPLFKEYFLGIELETPNGKHDGVHDGLRYFRCKADHGIFAKFSKVVMVWSPRR